MRATLASLFVGLALTACTAGSRVIVIREPTTPRPSPDRTPAVIPAPAREALDPGPLEITIGRPYRGHVFVHTNRPAYVAIFEIIPDERTSLVKPANVRERRMVISGLTRVPIWWNASPNPRSARAAARPNREVRYIYAIAAERPIRLEPEAFRAGFFPRALGVGVYRARNPYVTMRALARRFAPDVGEMRWAEDVYVYESWRTGDPFHVARVYCRGVAYDIPEDLADRAWCPRPPHIETDDSRPAGAGAVVVLPQPVQPDSVRGNNGRRVQRRAHGDPTHRAADRVREPMPGERGRDRAEEAAERDADRGNANPGNQGGQGRGGPPDQAGPPATVPANPRAGPPANVPANPRGNPPANPAGDPPGNPRANPGQNPRANPAQRAPADSAAKPPSQPGARPPANPPAADRVNPPGDQRGNQPGAQRANPAGDQRANPSGNQRGNPAAGPPSGSQEKAREATPAGPPAGPPARGRETAPTKTQETPPAKAQDNAPARTGGGRPANPTAAEKPAQPGKPDTPSKTGKPGGQGEESKGEAKVESKAPPAAKPSPGAKPPADTTQGTKGGPPPGKGRVPPPARP